MPPAQRKYIFGVICAFSCVTCSEMRPLKNYNVQDFQGENGPDILAEELGKYEFSRQI
jgi:hypothetical protein